MIAALILAGPGGPERLAEQWLALRGAGLDPLRIATGRGARGAPGSGLARENFVADRSRAGTPFSALQSGLRALLAADEWDAVVIQPAEAPPPHPSVVLALLERLADGDAGAVRPAHGRRGGYPVAVDRTAAEVLLDLDPRRATLEEVLAELEDAGLAVRLEVYTDEVLSGPRRGSRR
ncbi:MAG TPA: NTP transferase domain-containing protein [Anaeromyxobacteraceae bacterium]|nr:NTP transferase domain-containing protein [Anaeromyxobacteraceae bacterium]